MDETATKKLEIQKAVSWSLNCYSNNFKQFLLCAVFATSLRILLQFLSILHVSVPPLVFAALGILSIVFGIIFFMALIIMVGASDRGEPVELKESVLAAFKKFWAFAGGGALAFVTQMSGILFMMLVAALLPRNLPFVGTVLFLLLCIAAISFCLLLGALFSMYPFVVVLEEDLGAVPSLKRSAELTSSVFWQVVGAHLSALAIVIIVILPVALGLNLLGFSNAVTNTGIASVAMVITPFLAGYYYQIYLGLKELNRKNTISVYEVSAQ